MITAETTNNYRALISKLVRARHSIIKETRGQESYMVTVATSDGLASMRVGHDRIALAYRGSVLGYDIGYDGIDRTVSHLPVFSTSGHVS